ncbi:MAG: hypothetical protein GY816_13800 [Cytophagales bacterium]|nr:hypothetical protein [Cytophagales bacterium]
MQVAIKVDYIVEIPDSNIETITACFKKVLLLFLREFVTRIVNEFAIQYMNHETQPFTCTKCGSKSGFVWKTKHAKNTKIATIFGTIILCQMQVQCKSCGKKMYITRKLLGIASRRLMSVNTKKIFSLLGSLTSFRISEKILKMVGVKMNKMAVWRCTQEVGEKLEFDLDINERARGEADGTGVAINGIKKRGKELKVFVQEKITGGVRIAGLSIGKYEGEWDKLFEPLKSGLKAFESFLLVTDGDSAILKSIKGVKILFQRCLWHLPYQMKYYLWKDGVTRKTQEWYHILGEVFDITAIRYGVDDEKEIEAIVKAKSIRLESLILYCLQKGYTNSQSYLENARENIFTAFKNKLEGKTTSKVERVMKTVNMRIKMGKWSVNGALNAIKVRLAHYYNGFDPLEEMDQKEVQVFDAYGNVCC